MSITKPIPKKTRDRISQDPYYKVCARMNRNCNGRITIEHAITYAGKRIDDYWALIPLCVWHHLGGGLTKRINIQIAVSRATAEDRKKYPRFDFYRYEL